MRSCTSSSLFSICHTSPTIQFLTTTASTLAPATTKLHPCLRRTNNTTHPGYLCSTATYLRQFFHKNRTTVVQYGATRIHPSRPTRQVLGRVPYPAHSKYRVQDYLPPRTEANSRFARVFLLIHQRVHDG